MLDALTLYGNVSNYWLTGMHHMCYSPEWQKSEACQDALKQLRVVKADLLNLLRQEFSLPDYTTWPQLVMVCGGWQHTKGNADKRNELEKKAHTMTIKSDRSQRIIELNNELDKLRTNALTPPWERDRTTNLAELDRRFDF